MTEIQEQTEAIHMQRFRQHLEYGLVVPVQTTWAVSSRDKGLSDFIMSLDYF